ncbi:MAG: hypothetical protein ACE5G8_08370 [Anaerolineae bacterium]
MGFETIFLIVVALLAILIILGTGIAVIIIMRRSASAPSPLPASPTLNIEPETAEAEIPAPTPSTHVPTPVEDIEAYLAEQRKNLVEFELPDLSTTFRGTTNDGQRKGIILHLSQPDTPLIAFTSQAFTPQNGAVTAETVYGKMELIIAQGKAGVQWEGDPLGVLEFSKQRILGPEGELLGSIERPAGSEAEVGSYPVSFLGQPAATVNTTVNSLSTLRWFGTEDTESLPAFTDLAPELEDAQTLLLVATLLLEIGFFNLL